MGFTALPNMSSHFTGTDRDYPWTSLGTVMGTAVYECANAKGLPLPYVATHCLTHCAAIAAMHHDYVDSDDVRYSNVIYSLMLGDSTVGKGRAGQPFEKPFDVLQSLLDADYAANQIAYKKALLLFHAESSAISELAKKDAKASGDGTASRHIKEMIEQLEKRRPRRPDQHVIKHTLGTPQGLAVKMSVQPSCILVVPDAGSQLLTIAKVPEGFIDLPPTAVPLISRKSGVSRLVDFCVAG